MEFQFVNPQGRREPQEQRQKKRLLGPLDLRKRTARCENCARAHRRCGGRIDGVCSQCLRLGLSCTYPHFKRRPTSTYLRPTNQESSVLRLSPHCTAPPIDPVSKAIDFFFQRFLPQNNFSGHPENLLFDVHIYSHDNAQVSHAIKAVGALAMSKDPQTAHDPALLVQGLESYQACLCALSTDLTERKDNVNAVPNLWVVLLLGIFELMQDRTGQAYFQHLGPGALQALESLGPKFFRQGCARRVFHAWQWFDLSRCVLLSQPSLLSRQGWAKLFKPIGHHAQYDLVVPMLEHLFICSDFVSSALGSLRETKPCRPATIPELEALSSQAWEIHRSLANWGNSLLGEQDQIDSNGRHNILARTYFWAISIYLSSPFDYFDAWRSSKIPTPALTQDQVSFHVDRIIEIVEQCLSFREIAGPALLFPLRIAGARSRFDRTSTRKRRIMDILERLAQVYAAAEAISVELKELWQTLEDSSVFRPTLYMPLLA